MICDLNKSQKTIDWDVLAPQLDFVVIKASGLYENQGDPLYARHVAAAVAHGVPFHVFHFLYCKTEAEARRDAALFYTIVAAQGVWPLFWVLDCEAGWGIANDRARPVAEAFEAELRRLAAEDGPSRHGHFLSAIDISRLMDEDEYARKMSELEANVKACGASGAVLLPGERSRRLAETCGESVELKQSVVDEFESLEEGLG